MKQATNDTNRFSAADFLTAMYGYLDDEIDKKLLDTAWLFAYSVLWNDQQFSGKEKQEAKYYIKQWLNAPGNLKAFKQFCQRIVLARQNIGLLNKDFLTLPSLWFDPQNAEGFAATGEWLNRIIVHRRSLPNHEQELKALAEALVEFTDDPSKKNFLYWRSYFIDRETPLLLNLFTVFCANKHLNLQ